MTTLRLVIKGQPASKSNRRKLATIGGRNVVIDGKKTRVGGRASFIKSDEARAYEDAAILQIPHDAKLMLTAKIRMTLRIFYVSEQSDLDESVILDVLQAKYAKRVKGKPRELLRKGVYLNDRQVRERHVYHGIDATNPRAEIEIETMEPQQTGLDGFDFEEKAKPPKRVKREPAPSLKDIPEGKPAF